MRFQIRYENDLNIVYNRDPSYTEIAIHFAQNGYDPLYVYKNNQLKYIVLYEDFVLKNLNYSLERDFIKEYNTALNKSRIENDFLRDLDSEWLVYVNGGKVVCEINSLIELPLQNSVSKNLIAIRYIKYFYNELYQYFRTYKSIMILADIDIYLYIRNQFPRIEFLFADRIELIIANSKIEKLEIILDFLYGPRIRRFFCDESLNFVDLNKILIRPALDKLIKLSGERGVNLLFYKLPRFNELNCLSSMEDNNFRNRKKCGQLINEKNYLKLFARSIAEERYLKMKDYHASQRLDNGYCFVMDESNNPKLHVHDGVRLNGTKEIKGVKACNFYGPCTAYGFFVEDRLTVPALLQKYAINDGKLLQTYNRAGIHGDNELNSIMQAMSVPVAPGDVHIFLDVIEDLPVGLYPNYVYTNRWFNENKSRNEVQFLDFPGHCNSAANRIMAKNIYEDIKQMSMNDISKDVIKSPLLDVNYNEFDMLKITHSSCIKQLRIINRKDSLIFTDGKIGAVVITGDIEENICEDLIVRCLNQCNSLYVFLMNDNIELVESNRIIYKKIVTQDERRVKAIPLEHYYNSQRYLDCKECVKDCFEKAVYTERCFHATILNGLKINTRFIIDDNKYEEWNRAILKAADIFHGNVVKIKYNAMRDSNV